MLGYIAAAFGFVAGLAWNDAIKTLLDRFYPAASAGALTAKFVYAGVVTLIVVIISVIIFFLTKEEEES